MSKELRCAEQSLVEKNNTLKEKDSRIVVSTSGLAVLNFFKNYLVEYIDLLRHLINYSNNKKIIFVGFKEATNFCGDKS